MQEVKARKNSLLEKLFVIQANIEPERRHVSDSEHERSELHECQRHESGSIKHQLNQIAYPKNGITETVA